MYINFTSVDVDLQRRLLDPNFASCELDDNTLHQLADAIGDQWTMILPLLSFTTADFQQIGREHCPAWAMLQKLKEKGILTYKQLCSHLQKISLLNPTIWTKFTTALFQYGITIFLLQCLVFASFVMGTVCLDTSSVHLTTYHWILNNNQVRPSVSFLCLQDYSILRNFPVYFICFGSG